MTDHTKGQLYGFLTFLSITAAASEGFRWAGILIGGIVAAELVERFWNSTQPEGNHEPREPREPRPNQT